MSQNKVIKVSSIQMNCDLNDIKKNLAKAKSYIKEACKEGAQLIVIPELFSTGYRVEEKDKQLAETLHGDTILWLEACAKEVGAYLVAAILESASKNEEVYDTAVLVGPKGLVGSYRKVHLWDKEVECFEKGDQFPVFNTDIGNIGIQICYEIGFPEGYRILTQKGADIVACPSAFGEQRLYVWDIASRSRALENGIYHVTANRIGTDKDTVFGGYSRIINPQGTVLAENKSKEGVITSKIDLSEIEHQRKRLPYLADLNNSVLKN